MSTVLLQVIAGLILFLYAVNHLSETLQHVLGDNARIWIQKFTKSLFSSILVGTVITTLLDSSSAVIIITIVFVNNRLLTFRQAIGIVLGANIGTTVSSQIIAMDVGKYSPLFLFAGFLLVMISKTERLSQLGKSILYFGILFFGLYTMENAVEPLRQSPYFSELLHQTELPIRGALLGALITLIIQSSSATVGMTIILAKKGLLSLSGSIAVMLGAELGTCSDTLLATIRGSRAAIRTGLFHLIFNLLSIGLGLAFFQPFMQLVSSLSRGAAIERTVANAHMLFNILGVLLVVGFVPVFEKLLTKWLPDTTPGAVSMQLSDPTS